MSNEKVVYVESLIDTVVGVVGIVASLVSDDGTCSVARGNTTGTELDGMLSKIFDNNPECDKITIIK